MPPVTIGLPPKRYSTPLEASHRHFQKTFSLYSLQKEFIGIESINHFVLLCSNRTINEKAELYLMWPWRCHTRQPGYLIRCRYTLNEIQQGILRPVAFRPQNKTVWLCWNIFNAPNRTNVLLRAKLAVFKMCLHVEPPGWRFMDWEGNLFSPSNSS